MSATNRMRVTALAGAVVVALVCQLIAHATRHDDGAGGVISWVGFSGFWIAVAAAAVSLVMLAGAAVQSVRTRS